jgi:ribose 5-phosphate isomerase B
MVAKTISIGCDHAGYIYREAIIGMLRRSDCELIDHGTSTGDAVDYPDHIHPVARDVENGNAEMGIIICGSGNGAAITANKHQAIRAALCWKTELAGLARMHNDANILAIPARFVSLRMAKKMVNVFLNTGFEGGRHQKRVEKIPV